MKSLHVFTDFDGTITEPDTLRVLVERVGGGPAHYRETGRLLRTGAMTLRDALARDMATLCVPFETAASLLRAEVRIDPGFDRLVHWCATGNVPLTILSAGFHEIVELFLPAAAYPGVDVRANRFLPGTWSCAFRDDTALGHDKAAAVLAARRRGRRTVFIGDGISDQEPARVADAVFAKRGGSLVDFCRRQKIPCEEFDTLDQVLARLKGWTAARERPVAGAPE
jgi:HAD superfamily phosphoserine phosphatase-like hydrolase